MLVNAGNYANLSEQANPAANARRLVLDYDETQAVFKRLAQAHSDNPCSGLYPTTVASRGEPETLSLIWRRLCGKKRRSAGASQSATDAFFSELYRACG
ncbi:MAG: hypothetical protein PSW75_02435 [bacterium]|nr:hypothetical protein [bacterium]